MLMMIMAIEDDADRRKAMKLYENYEQVMFFAAKRILKDDARAEDAVHNAFEGIIRNLDTIKNPDSIEAKSYVIRAAKNHAINMYHRDKRTVSIDENQNMSMQLEKLQSLDVDDQVKRLMEDIYQLPEKYRDILILRTLHGYTYKEISIAYHISEHATAKRMERARQKLKDIMEGR